jgi:hypothetical protein
MPQSLSLPAAPSHVAAQQQAPAPCKPGSSTTTTATAMAPNTRRTGREEADEDEELLCVICLDRWRDTLLVHGDEGYMCVCGMCCGQLGIGGPCPICRQPIEQNVTLAD